MANAAAASFWEVDSFWELSGWLVGLAGLVLGVRGIRKQRSAEAAVNRERRRFKQLELLRDLDEIERRADAVERAYRAGDHDAAERTLASWREAARAVAGHLGPNQTRARSEAWRDLHYAVRGTQAMAGLGGSINVGAKTMPDAVRLVDGCRTPCSELALIVRSDVYGTTGSGG